MGAWAALTVGVGYVAAEFVNAWFESGTTKKSVEVLPPTGTVHEFSAFIIGSATSDFPVSGHYGSFGCDIDIDNKFHALASITYKIGEFEVIASADQSQVNIALHQPPTISSGFDMSRSSTDIDTGWSLNCDPNDAYKLEADIERVAQATADTIGDCILARPDFQAQLNADFVNYGKVAYPNANVTVTMPPAAAPGTSQAVSALDALREEVSEDGITINSGAVDNCEFKKFTMRTQLYLGEE